MSDSLGIVVEQMATIWHAGNNDLSSNAVDQYLPPAPERPRINATTGIGKFKNAPAGAVASGSGIASPLTEASRTLHTTQAVSSDGLFVWSVPDKITMTDAEGRTVEFIYTSP
jgi:hypothetical protein